ncbi:SOS response-associated peptidase [Gymnodinialimonas sp. 2305UL16-5]|uniref:SOS response-associated peptidase n=1 Tax=Gymnodinialimonas mytili TaxID=3126503 RepID=UPI0030B1588E
MDVIAVYLCDTHGARDLVIAFPDLALADAPQEETYSSPSQAANFDGLGIFDLCNLYASLRGQDAIRDMAKVWEDQTGNLPPLPSIYPDQMAPVVYNGEAGRILATMRWGMPSPAFALRGKKTDRGVTNVRNTKSPHWRRWLGVEHRCVVPLTAFSEPHNRPGKPSEPVWFALDETQPLAFFAGIWTEWTSVRRLKDGETTDNLFGFLTTEPNTVVGPIHPKAMPVILRTHDEVDLWLTAPTEEALRLQRPLPDDALIMIDAPTLEIELS